MLTKCCESCRYWSEMIAEANGNNPIKAMCLSGNSPHKSKMVHGKISCNSWAYGYLGAVDAPGNWNIYNEECLERFPEK